PHTEIYTLSLTTLFRSQGVSVGSVSGVGCMSLSGGPGSIGYEVFELMGLTFAHQPPNNKVHAGVESRPAELSTRPHRLPTQTFQDRKSTRLNSSHLVIS